MENTVRFKTHGGSWVNAYETYGITLEETSLSKLMTPAPNKEVVENKSDLQHGKRVDRSDAGVKKDERNLSLILNLSAPDSTTFLQRYAAFCTDILDKGFFDMKCDLLPGKVFRMTYLDCTQFSEFMLGIGKFTLSLNEPDPTNRGESDSWT